jgi:hypothetical protein
MRFAGKIDEGAHFRGPMAIVRMDRMMPRYCGIGRLQIRGFGYAMHSTLPRPRTNLPHSPPARKH